MSAFRPLGANSCVDARDEAVLVLLQSAATVSTVSLTAAIRNYLCRRAAARGHDACRRRRARRRTNRSQSSSVVAQPPLTRIAPGGQIALSHRLHERGWALTLPDEQADARRLTMTPARSKNHDLLTRTVRSPRPAMRQGVAASRSALRLAEHDRAGGLEAGLGSANRAKTAWAKPWPQGRHAPLGRPRRSLAMPGDILGPGPAAPLLPRRRAGDGANTVARVPKDQAPRRLAGRPACAPTASGCRAERRACRPAILPAAWIASTCSQPSAARTKGAASTTGWITPVSLLA